MLLLTMPYSFLTLMTGILPVFFWVIAAAQSFRRQIRSACFVYFVLAKREGQMLEGEASQKLGMFKGFSFTDSKLFLFRSPAL